jgi:hypothetical protein
MPSVFRVMLCVCVIATLPLTAQTAAVASSAAPADASGLTALSARVQFATPDSAISTDGTKPFPQFSSQVAGSQLAVLRYAPPLADLSTATPKMPPPAGQKNVTNSFYWLVNSALVAASVANSETLYNCSNCTAVPSSLHRRGVTYGVGLPIDAGVAYLGYYLKKNGHHWWYAPALALTAANGILAYHWAASTN